MITQLFHGFSMALADSVPGVSGGTVAFILGFYEPLLNALHLLFGKERDLQKNAFFYLVKLGTGWGCGMVLSILVLARLFEAQVYVLSSLFLGLTIASLPIILLAEKNTMRGRWKDIPFTATGTILVCALTMLRFSPANSGLDYSSLTLFQYIWLFIAGMLAITAMVLPGISGSTLLLIFGVYLPTVSAIKGFLSGNWAVVPGLIALGLGVLCGAAASVRLIRAALRKHREEMLYLIVGLMLGSLFAIVMGPTTLSTPQPPLDWRTFSLPGFLLGIAILLGLEMLKKRTAANPRKGDTVCTAPADETAV